MRNQEPSTSQSSIQSRSSSWNQSADVRFTREFFKWFDVNYHPTFCDDRAEEIVYGSVLNRHKEEFHKVLFDMGFYSVDDNDPKDICYDEDGFLEYVQEYIIRFGPEADNYEFGNRLIDCLNEHLGADVF